MNNRDRVHFNALVQTVTDRRTSFVGQKHAMIALKRIVDKKSAELSLSEQQLYAQTRSQYNSLENSLQHVEEGIKFFLGEEQYSPALEAEVSRALNERVKYLEILLPQAPTGIVTKETRKILHDNKKILETPKEVVMDEMEQLFDELEELDVQSRVEPCPFPDVDSDLFLASQRPFDYPEPREVTLPSAAIRQKIEPSIESVKEKVKALEPRVESLNEGIPQRFFKLALVLAKHILQVLGISPIKNQQLLTKFSAIKREAQSIQNDGRNLLKREEERNEKLKEVRQNLGLGRK